jgi:hypothetical protein
MYQGAQGGAGVALSALFKQRNGAFFVFWARFLAHFLGPFLRRWAPFLERAPPHRCRLRWPWRVWHCVFYSICPSALDLLPAH